ncbi:hypothetical protein [Xanthomonas vesicatoria]|uniref:Uncharacterized protein n=1 Tax=Xanthomonas vesicatoria TaxID=56460 RepID=A0ABS8LFL8_9XANT|nr:hypothetical protein [Xanthomonas vesicatoria]MCC8557993.1 hypothetical protein [Xanthomonas vesicatoria]MCC8598792.1 hypothetical protein [Xanthomonas vesicatoria]MCC8603072.1 hypothetical protein [Xanthomonas vesicatoria]MCC8607366.1 hypothetical protein [Xanthomonas vesicatoria]MCC8618818.1 hypothetical protein [Xanthomonas vesicatoria]
MTTYKTLGVMLGSSRIVPAAFMQMDLRDSHWRCTDSWERYIFLAACKYQATKPKAGGDTSDHQRLGTHLA